MWVTLPGIVILVSPVQLSKACSPMLVTLSGMVTLVKPLQSLKAYTPMLVTGCPPSSDGITISPAAVVSQSVICAVPSTIS